MKEEENMDYTEYTITYYFYKCVGAGGKEYFTIDCSVDNPKYDAYDWLDSLYLNGSKFNINHDRKNYHLYNYKDFFAGLKTVKGKYKTRLLKNVFIGTCEETILSLGSPFAFKRKFLEEVYKKFIGGSYFEIEWKPYEEKEIRRQKRLEKDGRWVNETNMFNFIKKIYPDAVRQWRPAWLVSEKGGQLSCDVYIPSINTAFEYQGRQHFEFIPFFDEDEESFERRQYLDKLKKNLLHSHGVDIKYVNYDEVLTLSLIKNKLKVA